MGKLAWFDVAAVDVADCVEVFGISPGSCNGTWDVFDDDALMLDAPVLPDVPTPPAAAEPLPAAPDSPEGSGRVGTLSGSETVPVVDVVWAWAIVMPKAMIAIRKRIRIALSPAWFSRSRIARQRATSKKEKAKFRKSEAREPMRAGGWAQAGLTIADGKKGSEPGR